MFGIINNAANASADQKSHFGRASEKVFLDMPERELTFQLLMSPSDPFAAALGVGGFSGMVVKPWNQRTRSISQMCPDVQAKLNAIPGLQVLPRDRGAAAAATSGWVHSHVNGRAGADVGDGAETPDQGDGKRRVLVSARD
jgi:hypothetical protein